MMEIGLDLVSNTARLYFMHTNSGEVRTGCEKFVEVLPKDLQETLLHIATKNGDADLVAYLDRHGK